MISKSWFSLFSASWRGEKPPSASWVSVSHQAFSAASLWPRMAVWLGEEAAHVPRAVLGELKRGLRAGRLACLPSAALGRWHPTGEGRAGSGVGPPGSAASAWRKDDQVPLVPSMHLGDLGGSVSLSQDAGYGEKSFFAPEEENEEDFQMKIDDEV